MVNIKFSVNLRKSHYYSTPYFISHIKSGITPDCPELETLQRDGEAIQLCKEPGREKPVDITPVPGKAGEINCTITKPAGSEHTHLAAS